MKFLRHATANWKGTGKEGIGKITTQSTALDNANLSFKTRFADGVGTNPEELIAASHSGCFTMKLSFVLNSMGYTAENIDTKATVTLDGDSSSVTLVSLEVTASIPEISSEDFEKAVLEAKLNCPISKLLNCEIETKASLV